MINKETKVFGEIEREIINNPGKKMPIKRLEASRKKIVKLKEDRTRKCREEEAKNQRKHTAKKSKCAKLATKAKNDCTRRNKKTVDAIGKNAHYIYQDQALKRCNIYV